MVIVILVLVRMYCMQRYKCNFEMVLSGQMRILLKIILIVLPTVCKLH